MTTAPRIELAAALSVGSDLALGSPLESGLARCLLATAFARTLDLGADDARTVFHLAMVRHIGCTADNHELAATFGSEMGLHDLIDTLDMRDEVGLLAALAEHAGAALPSRGSVVTEHVLPLLVETTLAACEVGAMLADRLGFGQGVRSGLLASYERWDGRGIPGRVSGESVPLPVRVVQVADAAVGARDRGIDPTRWLIGRAGSQFDPRLVARFVDAAPKLLPVLERSAFWDALVALEPAPRQHLSGHALDDALRSIGEFADLKSPYLVGHSAHVAALAGDAAELAKLDPVDVTAIRRAGWIHDLGRVGVSAATWGRPGPLTRDEWERVRLHPYHTGRVLDGARSLAGITAIATLHHERLDGNGYTRAAPAPLLPTAARFLAAADAYAAMTEARPHRQALDREVAARELRTESRIGRLDGRAVEAVLEAGGHRPRRRTAVAGLTVREIEVLGMLARGRTNREIAETLSVSRKTVDAHVQHLYVKAGVTTRAGATLFAAQHGLLAEA